ncbi:DUF3078 domain-containing protein [uncultured Prevotella sp.]|uniref:DUF3078 domain-containing protein n=1 Tax=uncultured Prevotella sp. TaxID=159272 RepID=UPI002634E5AC|nr:DUF3078 domain-containing protein [uncultured Prevotella sp.]
MKQKALLIFITLQCLYVLACTGKPAKPLNRIISKDSTLVVLYIDSLRTYKAKMDSSMLYNIALGNDNNDDARFFRIFAPLTFYYSVANNCFGLENRYNDVDDINGAIDNSLMYVYVNHPELVQSTEKDLRKIGSLHEEITTPIKHKIDYSQQEVPVPEESPNTPLEIVIDKPNFWTFGGDYYLQFLQNYVSSNWYKGGESNYSMVASATLQANYNNKQKVKFENKLEMKLGLQTSSGDTLHSFKTSEDLIRYTGKLGLQATKNWYYTLQLIAYTQFMRGYKSNDPDVYSDILSPFNLNLSLGMSYTVKAFNDKLTGSVQLAPLAYNFRYVGRKSLATRYGLDEGSHTMNDFGSECTIDLTWAISELIKWKTRLYGYTTYERTEVEWENTLTFQFNKYISSNIFIYPRFDDGSSVRDDHYGYWQFKEYASIGFAYSF